MMDITFGTRRMDAPAGMLRPIHWPQMALMDQPTGDKRELASAGGGVRELPRPFYAQFNNDGHYGASLVGSIDQVTLHDDGNISGWGWILDDDNGHNLVRYRQANALRHNSVDLAEVKAEIVWGSDDPTDPGFWEIDKVLFTEWKIGATTAVGMPAFPDARFDLPELTAALTTDEPLVMDNVRQLIHIEFDKEIEMVASASTEVPWADFHIEESDHPHKIIVDRTGRVYGHLGQWDVPHRGFDGVERYIPRPKDGYREFNHPGPMTEKGQVGTGPLFLLGGHPDRSMRGLTREQINQAYGDVANAWADVRVTEGKFGPWVSGRVRPGLSEAQLYTARCSHISGHWIGDQLVAIPCVNVPGFLPGAGFSSQTDGVLELVAGFAPTVAERLHFFAPSTAVTQPAAGISYTLTFSGNTVTPAITEATFVTIPGTELETGIITEEVDPTDEEIDESEDLALEFAFDDD